MKLLYTFHAKVEGIHSLYSSLPSHPDHGYGTNPHDRDKGSKFTENIKHNSFCTPQQEKYALNNRKEAVYRSLLQDN